MPAEELIAESNEEDTQKIVTGNTTSTPAPKEQVLEQATTGAQLRQPSSTDEREQARMKGYEGDPCPECSSFTLVRNRSCLKCDSCGATTGCS